MAISKSNEGENIVSDGTTEKRINVTMPEEVWRQNADRIRQLAEERHALMTWEQEEAGRRDEERYARQVLRRAPFLFVGGDGGCPDQPEIRRRVMEWLGSLLAREIETEDDPFLADLLWWKGEQLALVEVSLQVNGNDVRRAARRAATLRQATVLAMGTVIGEEWATPDTRERARASGVAWKVGADLSEGFLAFRRLPGKELSGI
jgi:hypothetical protein